MDENMEVVSQTDAIPEDDMTESTGEPVDTTAAEGAEQPEEDAIPTSDSAQEEAQPEDVPPSPFITVPHNHKLRGFSRNEAEDLIQRGLHYGDTLEPKLRMLAAGAGKSVGELVDSIVAANERAMKERFLREAHGDESVAERLLQVERNRLQAAYDSSIAAEKEAEESAQKTLTDRLAAEFVELAAAFPNLKEFKDVPASVVKEAVNSGRNLYDAYLRYHYTQQKRIDQNQTAQKAAAAASTGSRATSAPENTPDPIAAAMMAGVWGD